MRCLALAPLGSTRVFLIATLTYASPAHLLRSVMLSLMRSIRFAEILTRFFASILVCNPHREPFLVGCLAHRRCLIFFVKALCMF
jgi:hypothetical protein